MNEINIRASTVFSFFHKLCIYLLYLVTLVSPVFKKSYISIFTHINTCKYPCTHKHTCIPTHPHQPTHPYTESSCKCSSLLQHTLLFSIKQKKMANLEFRRILNFFYSKLLTVPWILMLQDKGQTQRSTHMVGYHLLHNQLIIYLLAIIYK